MKKQIISLGALAVASSLFTWDNKADAIVTKDYSGKSQVNAGSKNGTLIDSRYLNSALYYLEDYIIYAIGLTNKYEYGDNIYKEAKDRLLEKVLRKINIFWRERNLNMKIINNGMQIIKKKILVQI